jgi:hypothetical protein
MKHFRSLGPAPAPSLYAMGRSKERHTCLQRAGSTYICTSFPSFYQEIVQPTRAKRIHRTSDATSIIAGNYWLHGRHGLGQRLHVSLNLFDSRADRFEPLAVFSMLLG